MSDRLTTLLDARPRVAAGLWVRRVLLDGQPTHLLQNPLAARFFRADPAVASVLTRLDGRRTVRDAIAQVSASMAMPTDQRAVLAALSGMIGAGLLTVPGAPPPRRPSAAQPVAWRPLAWRAMGGLLFLRLPLGDLGPLVRLLAPVLGPLFTRAGLACFLALLAAALLSLVGESARLHRDLAAIFNFDAYDVLFGAVLFLGVKLLHETGHAVAALRMGRAEGLSLRVFRFGGALMFGLPTLYTDVTAAWSLTSRRRRAVVGLGGVYVETWITALAVLAWAWTRDGALGDWPLRLMLISGVSTVLFNLNPLTRLDGYYIASDVLGIANLQGRARAATRAMMRRLFGGADTVPPGSGWMIGWNLASLAYRTTVFLAAFWAAAHLHWGLGVITGMTALSLMVGQPLAAAFTWLRRGGVRHRGRLALAGLAVAGLALAALLVPLPHSIVAQGVVQRSRIAFVFAPADGQLVQVAPPGEVAAGTPLITLRNNEKLLLQTQLDMDLRAGDIRAREAAAREPEKLGPLLSRQDAIRDQQRTMGTEVAAWRVTAPIAGLWDPVRARALSESWVRRDDPHPLGLLVPDSGAELDVALDQQQGPLAVEALRRDETVRARPRDRPDLAFDAIWRGGRPEARAELPSPALGQPGGGALPTDRADARGVRAAERIYIVKLAVPGEARHLPQGTVVEVRLPLPPETLVARLLAWGEKVMQRRLAT